MLISFRLTREISRWLPAYYRVWTRQSCTAYLQCMNWQIENKYPGVQSRALRILYTGLPTVSCPPANRNTIVAHPNIPPEPFPFPPWVCTKKRKSDRETSSRPAQSETPAPIRWPIRRCPVRPEYLLTPEYMYMLSFMHCQRMFALHSVSVSWLDVSSRVYTCTCRVLLYRDSADNFPCTLYPKPGQY